MPRPPQVGHENAHVLRNIERRLRALEALYVRPETMASAYDIQDRRGRGLARCADGSLAFKEFTTNAGPYGGLASTDFAITDVVVDATRNYRVTLHSQVVSTGSTSPASIWDLALFVDLVDTNRISRFRFEGAGANQEKIFTDSLVWRPTSGNKDLLIVVGIPTGAGAPVLTFQASATATRQFYVEDIGPRT